MFSEVTAKPHSGQEKFKPCFKPTQEEIDEVDMVVIVDFSMNGKVIMYYRHEAPGTEYESVPNFNAFGFRWPILYGSDRIWIRNNAKSRNQESNLKTRFRLGCKLKQRHLPKK